MKTKIALFNALFPYLVIGAIGFSIGHYTRLTPAQIEAAHQEQARLRLQEEEKSKQTRALILNVLSTTLQTASEFVQTNRVN